MTTWAVNQHLVLASKQVNNMWTLRNMPFCSVFFNVRERNFEILGLDIHIAIIDNSSSWSFSRDVVFFGDAKYIGNPWQVWHFDPAFFRLSATKLFSASCWIFDRGNDTLELEIASGFISTLNRTARAGASPSGSFSWKLSKYSYIRSQSQSETLSSTWLEVILTTNSSAYSFLCTYVLRGWSPDMGFVSSRVCFTLYVRSQSLLWGWCGSRN